MQTNFRPMFALRLALVRAQERRFTRLIAKYNAEIVPPLWKRVLMNLGL